MSTNILVRHASYGLELVDALTGGPLLGPSAVTVDSGVEPFMIGGSRWIFEDLPAGPATFSISAQGYMPLVVLAADLEGDVPAATAPGLLARVSMTPRTGYPFPTTLTRIVGQVFLHASVDPAAPPVAGAVVTITPRHRSGPSAFTDDPDVTLLTTDDGQYTYWFLPDPDQDPPLVNELIVSVESGSLSADPLTVTTIHPHAVTNVPRIELSL